MVSIDYCTRSGHLANPYLIHTEYEPSNRSNSSWRHHGFYNPGY